MAVADGEAVEGHTTHEELAEDTVADTVDTAGAHALVVVGIAAIEVTAAIAVDGGVAAHLEGGGEHALADHLLEGLAAALHAVTLETVTEDLVEEHAAGGS